MLPALAGDSENALRKQLAGLEQQIKSNRETQRALYEKRTVILKKLHAARSAEFRKRGEAKRQAAQTKKPGSPDYDSKLKAEDAKKKAAAAKQSTAKKKSTPTSRKKKAEYAAKKAAALKAKKDAYAKKKAAAAKQSGTKKPLVKKPTTKKKPGKSTKSSKAASDIHKKAEASRAKFLKRFDQNRDGKVTKAEAKAVLTTEAKARAGGREKKKKK